MTIDGKNVASDAPKRLPGETMADSLRRRGFVEHTPDAVPVASDLELPEEPLETYPLHPGYMTWVNYGRKCASIAKKLKERLAEAEQRIKDLDAALTRADIASVKWSEKLTHSEQRAGELTCVAMSYPEIEP